MNYKVLSHDYCNTGGNCMVLVTTVWLEDEKKTVYVMSSEDGMTVSPCDWINNEIDFDYDTMVIDEWDSSLRSESEYQELYRDCWVEMARRDYRHYKTLTPIDLGMFTDKLLHTVSTAYIAWHIEEFGSSFETDGERIIMDERFDRRDFPKSETATEAERILHHMQEWLAKDSAADTELFYNMSFIIGFDTQVAVFYNNADIYSHVESLLKMIIEEE